MKPIDILLVEDNPGDARLTLRRHHGLAVDRGRLVREALALVLADLEAQGADSALVQRLLDE